MKLSIRGQSKFPLLGGRQWRVDSKEVLTATIRIPRAMIRIASFNVENLFARPKAFAYTDYDTTKPILDAYKEVNDLFKKATYTDQDKNRMVELLLALDIYRRNGHGAVRRHYSANPKWAWLRKNRGNFDREPKDVTQDVVITASGRTSWFGWVEVATEPTEETAITLLEHPPSWPQLCRESVTSSSRALCGMTEKPS